MASGGAAETSCRLGLPLPLGLVLPRVGLDPADQGAAMSPLHTWSSDMKHGPPLAESMRMRRGRQYQTNFKHDGPSAVFSLPWTCRLATTADGVRLLLGVR